MDRKNFTAIMDETFSKIEGEVRALKTQKQTLTININELESKKSLLSDEILSAEKKLEQVKDEYKSQVDKILKTAQEKLESVTVKEANLVRELANLDQKEKEASDLIKSNQGLQRNLTVMKNENMAMKTKLTALVDLIKKTLE